MESPFTTRQLAEFISSSLQIPGSVQEWKIRRLFEDGVLPERKKFGGKRMLEQAEVPEIVNGLRSRGWLPQPDDVTAFDQPLPTSPSDSVSTRSADDSSRTRSSSSATTMPPEP